MEVPRPLGALCGIAGPTAFVGAWLAGGLLADGYDPVRQAISELAREGAPTRPVMTAGLVAFGVLLPVWARVLRRELDSRALGVTVTVAGVATLAVALLPLTREPGGPQDVLHGVAAGTGYLAMSLTPLLAAPRLRRSGRGRTAAASAAVGAVSALALVGSLISAEQAGALQRLGLGVVDAWHVAVAVAVLRRGQRPTP
jgi:hypothetical membrane protein